MVDRLSCVGCIFTFRAAAVSSSTKVVSLCVSRSAYVDISCEGFSKVESHTGTIMEVLWPYPLLTRKELASLIFVSCRLAGDTSSCKQVGCFPLQIPHVCFLLQSLFLWPLRRHPKQRFFLRTTACLSSIDKAANLSHLNKEWPSISQQSHGVNLVSVLVILCWWVEVVARTFTLRLEFLCSLGGLVSVSLSAYNDESGLQAMQASFTTKLTNLENDA